MSKRPPRRRPRAKISGAGAWTIRERQRVSVAYRGDDRVSRILSGRIHRIGRKYVTVLLEEPIECRGGRAMLLSRVPFSDLSFKGPTDQQAADAWEVWRGTRGVTVA